MLPPSVKYIVASEHDGSYERAAAGHGPFQVVVNDGTRRNECAEQIVSELAADEDARARAVHRDDLDKLLRP